ncbi:pseudouridine synthase TruD/Pus7 [Cryomyces antarcticus]
MDTTDGSEEQPRKRMRLSSQDAPEGPLPRTRTSTAPMKDHTSQDGTQSTEDTLRRAQLEKEVKAGITVFVTPDTPGFSGLIKQRYTDFLVNEILPSGQVLHLDNTAVPPRKRVAEEAPKTETPAAAPKEKPTKDDAQTQPLNAETNSHDVVAEEARVKEGSPETQPERLVEMKAGEDESKSEEAGRNEARTADVSPEDSSLLQSLFGEKVAKSVIALHTKILARPGKKARDFNTITSAVIPDKDQRTSAHVAVRRIFSSRIDTVTADDGAIRISAAQPQNSWNNRDRTQAPSRNNSVPRAKGKAGWNELGGEYLHFTLYKENKDTMEVVYFIASQLKLATKHFQFAGTKDRRGVTAQRVSAYRVHAETLAGINKRLRGAKVGGYEYRPTGLELGDLSGNEFLITLRECHFPDENGSSLEQKVELAKTVVGRAVGGLKRMGFLNYYGLQRFGSFANGTDTVGMKMLKGDLEGAINDILFFSPDVLAAAQDPDSTSIISADDKARAEALHIWKTTGKSGPALDRMPRKFQAETAIIRHLGWTNRKTGETRPHDWQGALGMIQRNLRLMYVHAYQSLVWNVVVGKRWELYGDRVVEGDLVIVGEHKDKENGSTHARLGEELDDQGEVIVRPALEDSAATSEDPYARARALSEEEAESGQYNIYDIVLPLPGYDVEYPRNAIGDEYKTFMGSERGGGLNPMDMRRKWKDVSLSGGYRKIVARPGKDVSYEVRTYVRDDEQLVETDLERLQKKSGHAVSGEHRGDANGAADDGAEKKIAVVLKLQLGSSQYATMALRELMKGGTMSFKPDFHGGR